MISDIRLNKIALKIKAQAVADVGMIQEEVQTELSNLKAHAIEILSLYGDYLDDTTWNSLNNFSASLDKGIGMQDPSKIASNEEDDEEMEEDDDEDDDDGPSRNDLLG